MDFPEFFRAKREFPLEIPWTIWYDGLYYEESGKSQGLSGAIGGIADSYMSRSKARSVDAKLAKATKWVGAIFVILTLVLNCMVAAGL